jgi:hypothetical protein
MPQLEERVTKLEDSVNSLLVTVGKFEVILPTLIAALEKLEDAVCTLSSKPVVVMDKIVSAFVTAVVAALVTALMHVVLK